jgi:phosphate transport system protein
MRFGELIKALRGESILKKALDEFLEMMANCHWMFQYAADSLWTETDVEERQRAIRERDVLVNKAERSIRKRIIRHLAVNPRAGTNQSLVLMSVVKDAERLGDYAKNMVEVGEYHPTFRDENDLIPRFKDIQADIDWAFKRVGEAFVKGDEEEGQRIVNKTRAVARICDEVIEDILENSDLGLRQGVAYALLARYFKRFAAHLGNIATSLVMPVHKLDYYDEDDLKD